MEDTDLVAGRGDSKHPSPKSSKMDNGKDMIDALPFFHP
jgi:hypothetical protein